MNAVRVRYRLRVAAGESAERRAADLAREQSIEVAAGAAPAEVEARAIGRVAAIEPTDDGRFAVAIDYPLATFGAGDLPQLLNVLWGNVSLQEGVRVDGVDWPAELLAVFGGPRHGIAGLRELCNAHRRPLTATALKPLGLSARELARRAADCALGGIDLIKDDHGLADQAWAPFRERVLTVHDLVERANRARGSQGGSTLYAPNLTGPVDRLAERLETLAEAGVRAALVAPALLGFDAVRELAASSGLALVAHPAFAGTLAGGEHGLAPELLFGDLCRLAGADAVVFPAAGGRFPWSRDDVRAVGRRLTEPLGELRPSFLVLGGGVDRQRLTDEIPRHGVDTIWLVGGSLYAAGDLRRAAAEMAEVAATTPAGSAT
jgi:ribulose-bisphosphate carboxylase large chain